MEYNIGPETLVRDENGEPIKLNVSLEKLIHKQEDTSKAHELDYAMAATGYLFTKEYDGLLRKTCIDLYANRKKIKRQMLAYKADHERAVEEMVRRGLK